MDELVGGSAGYPLAAAIDQQHPLLVKGHPRRYQLLLMGLGLERQGSGHIPVVVIGNDMQRLLGIDAQYRPHILQGSRRRVQHVLRPLGDQGIVVIDRYQSRRHRKPLKAVVQIDKDLLLGAEDAAGGVPQLKGISHPSAGRKVVVAAAEQFRRAADGGSRVKLHLPVSAAADLPDSFQIDPDVVDFIRPGGFDKEVDAVGKAAFHPMGKNPNFPLLLGLDGIGRPIQQQDETEQGGQGNRGQQQAHKAILWHGWFGKLFPVYYQIRRRQMLRRRPLGRTCQIPP